jgi:hypothetical protein
MKDIFHDDLYFAPSELREGIMRQTPGWRRGLFIFGSFRACNFLNLSKILKFSSFNYPFNHEYVNEPIKIGIKIRGGMGVGLCMMKAK